MKQETFQYSVLSALVILILLLLVNIFSSYHRGNMHHDGEKNMHEMMMQQEDDMKWSKHSDDDAMKEHCKMMPEMQGCEKYTMDTKEMDHSMMDMSSHDPMQMSMADMGKMLQGKS